MKVLMIGLSNLGPYHFARFRALTDLLPGFTYVQCPGKELYRPWSSDQGPPPCRIICLENGASIKMFFEKEMPDVIMFMGYKAWTIIYAALAAKKRGVPTILHSDSTSNDHQRRRWKESAKKLVIGRLFDGAFVAGTRSASYATSLGIPENLIWKGVDVVDNSHFLTVNKSWQPPDNFPSTYFITVARLSPEKNISRLLSAFESYRLKGGRWGLVVAGTGPAEHVLKKSVPENISAFIRWHGWARYNELPSLYQGASCFILPSISEPWGLVVNEAMASGLPVLVSSNCGCVPELCHAGVNGYSFDPYDVEQLSELMLLMSSGRTDLCRMGETSRQLIREYTPEKWAETIFDMTGSLLKNRIAAKAGR
ncbi:MAG: glycosyltransferase family 4 protein [Nitrospirota bacterium]|nr:glycosyltransferase family 4 protein [Nitrospirota bacterium]